MSIAFALVNGLLLGGILGFLLGSRTRRDPIPVPPAATYRPPSDPMAAAADRVRAETATAKEQAAIGTIMETPEAQAAGLSREEAMAWVRSARASVSGRAVGGGLVDWTQY